MWFFTSEICSIYTLNKIVFSFTDSAWISVHAHKAELNASVKIYYETADGDGRLSSPLIHNYDLNNSFS
jgi:hypothetical protein